MFLFSILINDLPNIVADQLKLVPFEDDTSIIITNPSLPEFKEDIKNIIGDVYDWFRGNSLPLNFDKTYFIQFRPKIVMKLT